MHIHYISDYFTYAIKHKISEKTNKGKLTIDLGRKFDFDTPHINSLGKISKQDGYQNLFVQGSSTMFSGTYQFLLHNGFDEEHIFGEEHISLLNGDYVAKRDVFFKYFADNVVYTIFQDKISQMDKTLPFLAVMFTYELHHQGASDTGPDRKIRERTIIELNDFIDWFEKQDFYENTTLIVIGDHNRMGKNIIAGKKIYKCFF